ncbi:2117_t:CDS:2, partial [Cetraspora pellucida]
MYLSLTIVMDNYACSQLAVIAIIFNETKKTYQWILECLLCATNGLMPKQHGANVKTVFLSMNLKDD